MCSCPFFWFYEGTGAGARLNWIRLTWVLAREDESQCSTCSPYFSLSFFSHRDARPHTYWPLAYPWSLKRQTCMPVLQYSSCIESIGKWNRSTEGRGSFYSDMLFRGLLQNDSKRWASTSASIYAKNVYTAVIGENAPFSCLAIQLGNVSELLSNVNMLSIYMHMHD